MTLLVILGHNGIFVLIDYFNVVVSCDVIFLEDHAYFAYDTSSSLSTIHVPLIYFSELDTHISLLSYVWVIDSLSSGIYVSE